MIHCESVAGEGISQARARFRGTANYRKSVTRSPQLRKTANRDHSILTRPPIQGSMRPTEDHMASDLYTPGKLAEALGISAGKVKKLIDELKLEPDAMKGPCKYYGAAALKKLKAAAK